MTPCLKDNETGDFVQTEVVRIRRKSFLTKFNKKNGWYTDWSKLVQEHEIYALVVKGKVDIQGMVALNRNDDFQAVKAEHIAMLHPFQIAIYEEEAAELREVYDYEWTDEKI